MNLVTRCLHMIWITLQRRRTRSEWLDSHLQVTPLIRDLKRGNKNVTLCYVIYPVLTV